MRLQQQIKADLVTAMKAKDEDKKSVLRVIMGEFGRQAEKELQDDVVIKIIKKLVKSEKEVLERSGKTDNRFIEVADAYLPRMASEADIKAWIDANIDFSEFNNKMQAMKPIMQHFGADADGNIVKKVLGEI